MTDAIDLTTEQRNTLSDLLRRFLPDVAVWAYGSRVKWTARPNSDLDLVAFATPAQRPQVAELKDALAESNLPFPVDLHVWDDVPERFREIIRKEYVVVQEAKEPKSKTSMPGEWCNITLGQVTDFLSGGTPSKDAPQYWGGSIPWVSAKDMKRFRLDDTEDHVTEDGVANGTKLVPSDTVLLLARGMTLLNDVPICVVKKPMTFNQDVKALRPKPGVRNEFLPYLLLGNKERLLSLVDLAGHGTGRLNSDELKVLDVVLPPEPEQRAIAHILGALDDKIELNRKMNETLEAMARALFKSWFVDFDPVRAKAKGSDPGLPKPIADLFPDSFEDSELGEIPKGWGARSLYEAAEFVNGAAFRSEDFCDPSLGLPIVKIAELKDGIGAQTKFSERVLDPKQLIDTGELLYSWSGSPDTSLDAFLWTNGRGLLNQHIFKVITPTIAEKRFVYYLLKFLKPTLVEIARNKQTTGLGHVTVADMKWLYVCSPVQNLLAAFDKQVAPLFDRALKSTVQNQTLIALRDTLLPKLISGEVRVKHVEKFIGGTTV